MRIVIHAGLHKSGTSTVQQAWGRAYAAGAAGAGDVWYPEGGPGHHLLTWPLLGAFSQRRAPDLLLAALERRPPADGLHRVVREAGDRGVGTLVVSSEDLDRLVADDVPGLADVVAGHEVLVVLTATRPVHRWASAWQELVKHGLAQLPRDAARHVTDLAALDPGRLAEVARLLPGDRTIVRLVRPSPPEPGLAADLARLAGLPPAVAPELAARNTSLGPDVEVLRRVNAAGLGLGPKHGGRKALDAARDGGLAYRDDPALAEGYRPPDALWDAAATERDWLADPPEGVEVVDPHDQLAGWLDRRPPEWYELAGRQAPVVPDLDARIAATDTAEQLWRARQEIASLRARLRRARTSGA
ncbi:hypothetical protein GCM10023340_18800 [Nocardioides marinquilinus]|uniref:Sulfotransferase family protein n=1 Tax=Nocardioides marinquilinus TaxID=1210400 RepID=A0ABP9PPQ3_9ACTN